MTERAYVIGTDVFPSWKDAPDWTWEKVDGEWIEHNRPEPLFTCVYFPPQPKYKKEDYPDYMHTHVDDANAMSVLSIYTPIALGTASSQHLYEVLDRVSAGVDELMIYDGSMGYTRTFHGQIGGYVPNTVEPQNDFERLFLERIIAKAAGNWEGADAIRKSFAGLTLRDRREGTIYVRDI